MFVNSSDELSLDDKICSVLMYQPSIGFDTTAEHLRFESHAYWSTLIGGLSDDDIRQLGNASQALETRLNTRNFGLSPKGRDEANAIIELETVSKAPCDLKKSPIFEHFRKVMNFHEPTNMNHPIRRKLVAAFKLPGIDTYLNGLKSMSMVLGVVKIMGNILRKAIDRVNGDQGNHKYFAKWVIRVLNSGFVVGMANYFKTHTGGIKSLQLNVLAAYGVFEFIKAIGGFKAIKEVIVNVNKLPVIQMLKEAFAKTFIYKRIWHPISNFTREAYERTAEYLNNIGESVDPEYSKLPTYKKMALLNNIPSDVQKVLTPAQRSKLMKDRFTHAKKQLDSNKGEKALPVREPNPVVHTVPDTIDVSQVDPEVLKLYHAQLARRRHASQQESADLIGLTNPHDRNDDDSMSSSFSSESEDESSSGELTVEAIIRPDE